MRVASASGVKQEGKRRYNYQLGCIATNIINATGFIHLESQESSGGVNLLLLLPPVEIVSEVSERDAHQAIIRQQE